MTHQIDPTSTVTVLDELQLLVKTTSTPPEDYFVPSDPVGAHETVVGPATAGMRLLYHLAMHYRHEAEDLTRRLNMPRASDVVDKKDLQAKATAAVTRAKAILDLLWITARDEYQLWGKNIGIRDGSVIVTYEESGGSPAEFLKGLLKL